MTITEPAEFVAATDGTLSAYLDVSAELLRTITYVPDLRAALPRLSEIANRMLPHDALALDLVDPDGHLVTEATVGDLPEIAPRG